MSSVPPDDGLCRPTRHRTPRPDTSKNVRDAQEGTSRKVPGTCGAWAFCKRRHQSHVAEPRRVPQNDCSAPPTCRPRKARLHSGTGNKRTGARCRLYCCHRRATSPGQDDAPLVAVPCFRPVALRLRRSSTFRLDHPHCHVVQPRRPRVHQGHDVVIRVP